MNMAKLAELCGVSVSTVSKAFSKSTEISKEKREYIFNIAKENGCYDKYFKGDYIGKVVAVICPEFKSGIYAEQLSIMEQEIKKYGAVIIASCTNFDDDRRRELVRYFTEYAKVDGIICLDKLCEDKKYSVPMVALGEYKNVHSVVLSMDNAVDEAIRHFRENGHRNIAYLGEKLTRAKKDIFIKYMQKNGMQVNENYIVDGKGRFEEAGYDAMNRLFEEENVPTAILCAYDNIAIGAMKSIHEHGKKIPEDISVIGFNNIKELPYLDVPLTSITSHNEDLCQIIVELLFDVMEKNQENVVKTIKVSKQLVKRASVGKNPQ